MPDDNTPKPNDVRADGGDREVTGTSGGLTDGTGISKLTSSKLIKDIVLDLLMSAPVALLGANVLSLEAAVVVPVTVFFAIGDTVIRVGYRAALRWAQSS